MILKGIPCWWVKKTQKKKKSFEKNLQHTNLTTHLAGHTLSTETIAQKS